MNETKKKKPYWKKVYEAFKKRFYSERECYICGKIGKPQYHHVDPNKEHEIYHMWSFSRKRILREISKCIPICKQCHDNIHHGGSPIG